MLKLLQLASGALQEGFSASLLSLSTSTSVQLTGWSVASPYFGSANFNAATGNYTVPVTGLYSIEATVSYITNTAITASLTSNINPFFVVRRTSPAALNLIIGLLPVLDINVSLLTLRAILGNGAVTLSGEILLTAGDVINLYYNSNAMTVALTMQNVVWSVYRVA